MSIRIGELIGGTVFLVLTLLFWWQTMGLSYDGLAAARNPIWYPRLLLILAGLASVLLIIRSFSGGGEAVSLPDFKKMGAVFGLLAVYLFTFVQIGFIVASVMLIPLMSWILGYRRIGISVTVSVIFTGVIWYLFAMVFVVRPPGIGLDTLISYIGG